MTKVRCIFTGYIEHSKVYILENPVTKKIIISKDVDFKQVESYNVIVDKTIIVLAKIPYRHV